jgi:ketosteroid isomerase-like protein
LEAGSGTALDVVRRYADAWAAGDAATVVALYADDIVLHYFGDNPLAGDHAGKAAALAALGKISQAVRRAAPEIHDVLGGEHHAAILAKERWGEGKDAVELNRVLLYHVRDGKLSECWIYDGDQRAVDNILNKRLG